MKTTTPHPEPPLTGDALLAAVTDAMVVLHARYYHRVPAVASTQRVRDEILARVMGGVYTDGSDQQVALFILDPVE